MSWFYNLVYAKKDRQINELVNQVSSLIDKNAQLENHNNKLITTNINQSEQITHLGEEITNLNQEINSCLLSKSIYDIKQPSGTEVSDSWFTVDSIKLPANTFITPNSRRIKELILKNYLKGKDVKETADKVEKFVYDYITYVQDVENQYHIGMAEEYQSAEYTIQSRIGDCEDKAILFYTIMMMCGYGNEVVVTAGDVRIDGGAPLGHAYNRVLINNEWVLYDPTIIEKDELVDYPTRKNEWFLWNYVGIYKWLQ